MSLYYNINDIVPFGTMTMFNQSSISHKIHKKLLTKKILCDIIIRNKGVVSIRICGYANIMRILFFWHYLN